MRKYQQLFLVIVSCVSVGILLMYKTENRRLRDIVRVINFFGQNDAIVLRQRPAGPPYDTVSLNDYVHPMAVWQRLGGDGYHGYSAFWSRNELTKSGEAIALVVGRTGVPLNFLCYLNYEKSGFGNEMDDNYATKIGKFRFQRLEIDDTTNNLTMYLFFCKLKSSQQIALSKERQHPVSVTFSASGKNGVFDLTSLPLRMIRPLSQEADHVDRQWMTVCVDLVDYNFVQNISIEETISAHQTSSSALPFDSDLMQFFAHHYFLGVRDFILYNGDRLPSAFVAQIMQRLDIRLHLLPYNFPFNVGRKLPQNNVNPNVNLSSTKGTTFSSTLDSTSSFDRPSYLLRKWLLETDCRLRTANRARFTLLLDSHEFFYPNTNLDDKTSVLRLLRQKMSSSLLDNETKNNNNNSKENNKDNSSSKQITADSESNRHYYRLKTLSICRNMGQDKNKSPKTLDSNKINGIPLLMDNYLYDPEMSAEQMAVVLYPSLTEDAIWSDNLNLFKTNRYKNIDKVENTQQLSTSLVFVHRYVDCLHIGKDGLHDARNSIRIDQIDFLQQIRAQIENIL